MPEPDRKRLLYIVAVFPPARAPEADHALYQCLHFAERGIDVHVLTRSGQGVEPHQTIAVHDVVDSWSWRESPKILRLIRQLKPDAVMMCFVGTIYQYRTMPTIIPLMAKLLRPQMTFLVQFTHIGHGGGLSGRLRRFLFRALGRYRYGSLLVSPDVFVVLGEDHRQRIRALAPSVAAQTHIIPPCAHIPIARDRSAARCAGRRRLGIADHEILVTLFGRLYPGKGIEQLIEAVASLRPGFPNLRVGLIGGLLEPKLYFHASESYKEELHACIRRHGMTEFVRFSGEYHWNSLEASEYLYATDVAALPLGPGIHLYNSSLAALCTHGVPVIGTRGAVVDPALRHKENVYFISDSGPATIAAALTEVLQDEGLRRKLSEGSEGLAQEYFDSRRAAARLSDLMRLGPALTSSQMDPGSPNTLPHARRGVIAVRLTDELSSRG